MPAGKVKNDPALFLTPEQFSSLMHFIKPARQEIPLEFAENFPYMGKFDPQIRSAPKMCPVGILTCCIGVDGQVRGCPDQEDRELYHEGDLRQESFSDIWQRAFQRYRNLEILQKDPRCRLCADKNSCRGGCWAMREKNLHCYLNYLR